jgi:hypothetical protein
MASVKSIGRLHHVGADNLVPIGTTPATEKTDVDTNVSVAPPLPPTRSGFVVGRHDQESYTLSAPEIMGIVEPNAALNRDGAFAQMAAMERVTHVGKSSYDLPPPAEAAVNLGRRSCFTPSAGGVPFFSSLPLFEPAAWAVSDGTGTCPFSPRSRLRIFSGGVSGPRHSCAGAAMGRARISSSRVRFISEHGVFNMQANEATPTDAPNVTHAPVHCIAALAESAGWPPEAAFEVSMQLVLHGVTEREAREMFEACQRWTQ